MMKSCVDLFINVDKKYNNNQKWEKEKLENERKEKIKEHTLTHTRKKTPRMFTDEFPYKCVSIIQINIKKEIKEPCKQNPHHHPPQSTEKFVISRSFYTFFYYFFLLI